MFIQCKAVYFFALTMIHPFQIRAARGLIGMSQHELAAKSAVGLATIRRIEARGRELSGTAKILFRLQKALEAAGVIFLDGDDKVGPGIRLAAPLP